MPEKEAAALVVKWWHLLVSVGGSIAGLVYWTGRKEERIIAEQKEDRRRIEAIENSELITMPQLRNLQAICRGEQKQETSDALHSLQLNIQGLHGKVDHICSWIEKQEKDR